MSALRPSSATPAGRLATTGGGPEGRLRAAIVRRLGGSQEQRWLALLVAARLVATTFAAALLARQGFSGLEIVLLLYGTASTALLVAVPGARRAPVVWVADALASLGCVLALGDWRSPFYLLWLSTLALPAASLPLRHAVGVALAAPLAYLLVALMGGPSPGDLRVRSAETLAIYLALPFLLVTSLAYAGDALRRLARERLERERLAIEAERRRIAWELHDSAKQRLSAAHLLVSSLQGRLPDDLEQLVGRAAVELESAASDMDTSLAELRSPLEGRPLDEALRSRAAELRPPDGATIRVRGTAPPLPPLVLAHVYRIGCEAITNALRHADAATIDVSLQARDSRLRVRIADDGRGLPEEKRAGATGLFAMQSRAATIGARLDVGPGPEGRGTAIELDVPTTPNGG